MRLFTFGCSFTRYHWPTWANIVSQHPKFTEFQNWGLSAAGNNYIANQVVEAHYRHGFTADDTILIMWTNVAREDRYIKNFWKISGNIYARCDYDQHFVDNYFDLKGCYVRDLPLIHLVDSMLQNIGCDYRMMSMVSLGNPEQRYDMPLPDDCKPVVDLYQPVIDKILPSVYNVVFNCDWDSRPWTGVQERKDFHPLPTEHLEYAEKIIPEYVDISDEYRQYLREQDAQWKATPYESYYTTHAQYDKSIEHF